MPVIEVPMENCLCGTCFVIFSVPAEMLRQRAAVDDDIYCPNGHTNQFLPFGPTLEQRQDLIAALHRAEQAEAKVTELSERRQRKGRVNQ